jgi:hypothetical protein
VVTQPWNEPDHAGFFLLQEIDPLQLVRQMQDARSFPDSRMLPRDRLPICWSTRSLGGQTMNDVVIDIISMWQQRDCSGRVRVVFSMLISCSNQPNWIRELSPDPASGSAFPWERSQCRCPELGNAYPRIASYWIRVRRGLT